MNEIEQEELLYNKIYEQTKDFGRTHFVREIMRLNRENTELKEELKRCEKANVILDNQGAEANYKINKAQRKINNMFKLENEKTIIDDLLELDRILKGE